MIMRIAFAAAVASLLVAAPVFAEDAGSTDASSGVTPTADAGSAATDTSGASVADATTTPTSDAGSATPTGDAGGTGDDASGGGSFTVNPCWDEKCPKEVAVCKADPDCSLIAKCIKDKGDTAAKCAQDAGLDQAKFEAAFAKYSPISACGWTACADPNAGTCKDRCGTFDDKQPCNCDGLCHQYKDCCADHKAQCAAMYSCKGFCDSTISNQNSDKLACNCDASCPAGELCCEDYAITCGGTACVPKCAGKECGDDGCGKPCGACTGGAVCNSGKCIGGGEVDAGTSEEDTGASSGGSSSGGTVTDTSDTGSASSSGGTTTTPPADDGGCSATPTSNNGALALLLLAIGGMAILRRRFA